MPRGKFVRTPEYREKLRQAHLGKKKSPETREKMRQALLHRSPETREKIRQGSARRWARPEEREKMRQIALHRSPETREKMRQARLGTHPSPETREKMRLHRLRQRFPKKMTSIESALYTEFKKRRLKFDMHRTMFGRWQPDFVFEQARLIVEADGDYWHSRLEVRVRNNAMREVALADGWTVWRFGEQQINMHPAACGRAVARFVRDHLAPSFRSANFHPSAESS